MSFRALIPSTHKAKNSLSQILARRRRTTRSHNQTYLTELIDPTTASQRLNISSTTLEYLADACMITHYEIDGEIRFDPNDLNTWVHRHKIDELDQTIREHLTAKDDLSRWADL